MGVTQVSYGGALPKYQLAADHPMTPVRYRLAMELLRAYGLLDRADVGLLEPRIAEVDVITRVHPLAYVRAIQRYSENPLLGLEWEARQWGLTPGGDTPAVEGLHDRAAAVCGTSLEAVWSVLDGRGDRAIAVGGGLHHAFANRAAGFCVYNDSAVAVQAMLDAGAQRVAFVDVDAHHGDGVQWIFYEDPRVLTCSVHESGEFLFPGTGFLTERGAGEGVGTAINVPLPAFAGDEPYLRAVQEVVVPAVIDFRPDALVIEPGWDGHHSDILSHLQITMEGFRGVAAMLADLAGQVTDGRYAAIGGGGYTGDVLARGTAVFFAEMLGVELDDEIPDEYREAARELSSIAPSRLLYTETEFEAPADQRRQADREAHRIIDQARAFVA